MRIPRDSPVMLPVCTDSHDLIQIEWQQCLKPFRQYGRHCSIERCVLQGAGSFLVH